MDTNELPLKSPAMQSALDAEVVRLHSPDAVQHCAAILVPPGVAVAVGDVMQTPLLTASASPRRASTLKEDPTGDGGAGGGEGGDSRPGAGDRAVPSHDKPVHT